MKLVGPSIKSTQSSPDLREWVPSSFDNVLREIDHLIRHADGDDPLTLFRGHADHDWLLDCTLVRTMLRTGSNIRAYPRPRTFHTRVTDVLLQKFGAFWQPSAEAVEKEITHDIDPWYELMKRFQQYAEEDSIPKGTFLLDWTTRMEIALYFATYIGRGTSRQLRATEGALWLWDPVPTGKVLQTKKLGELLGMMRADSFRLHAAYSVPLILHPLKQTGMLRPLNQKPVYVAQMDFTHDLADVWCSFERDLSCAVFRKIILADHLLTDCVSHLESRGISEEHVYKE